MKIIPGIIATNAYAGENYTPHETMLMNTANTIWTLVAAFLVFGMQAGFVMLEAGFARQRETVNVLMECIFDTCLCGILFWAIGYAFMFSEGNGFIGYHWFFLMRRLKLIWRPVFRFLHTGFFNMLLQTPALQLFQER